MITSLSNPRMVEIRKLLDAKHRKQSGLFLAEGLKAVGQALDSQADLKTVVYADSELISGYGREVLDAFRQKNNVEIIEVSAKVFNSLARKDKPQGIAAVIRQQWVELQNLSTARSGIFVAVDSIQNPGNLGTIMRTCDAVGASGLILLNNSTDPYDPVSVKASMGSVFTVPLVKSDSAKFLDWAKTNSLPIIGTSDKAQQSCFTFDYPDPCLILMGSEREGLPTTLISAAADMVSIPMGGTADSLNISVATGIILYQTYLSHKGKN